MTRRLRYVSAALVIGLVAGAVLWFSAQPRNDRRWIVEQAVLPDATIRGDTVRIANVRDFEYTARNEFKPGYSDRTYDLSKLTSVWYVLTPFNKSWRGPAHSFVSFGFADSQFVAISVEARREPGETYDALTGLFKRFELMYVIGDERDLIGQRAAFDDGRVYLYPIRASPERIRTMFLSMLARANRLRAQPEFYNTLSNNCTSNVVDHVNRVAPRTVPAGIKTILPGYTDEVAFGLGLIDTDVALEQARDRYLINARAKRFVGDPAFSFRIREQDTSAVAHSTTRD
jgi:uncharacterized protein DUF4105